MLLPLSTNPSSTRVASWESSSAAEITTSVNPPSSATTERVKVEGALSKSDSNSTSGSETNGGVSNLRRIRTQTTLASAFARYRRCKTKARITNTNATSKLLTVICRIKSIIALSLFKQFSKTPNFDLTQFFLIQKMS